ncbi:hypothetical protein J7E95_20030, partial [Streptomyces sp. ISL-14]|nr:hypothetical protein [Streptomyces sp. ISL-14]
LAPRDASRRDPAQGRQELEVRGHQLLGREPYTLKWKVLNRGPEAERRDKIRGQIVDSSKRGVRIEHSDFRGEHVVECYVVKDGVVVARDRIDVPVSNTSVKTANVL